MAHQKQTSRSELIAELEAAGAVVMGNKIKCPFHDDRNPSAGVFQGQDGIWRFKCHSCNVGGDVFDIQARRTGKPLAEILRENQDGSGQDWRQHVAGTKKAPKVYGALDEIYTYLSGQCGGKLEDLHEYHKSDGAHNQYVIRWRVSPEKKEIRPVVKRDAGYVMEFPKQRVLYRLLTLADKKTVIITEGEQKADVLAGYGFPTTTSSGGSKAAHLTDWSPLAGRQVIIWPDYDEAGRGYAADVRRILEGIGCRVKIIDPSRLDLRESEDAKDYVDQLRIAGYDELAIRENLIDIFKTKTIATGPAAELDGYFGDVIGGRIVAIPTGLKTLDRFIQLVPETVNGVCGSPGASKSLWMLQLMAFWIEQGIRAACFMLERGLSFHLSRALAQRAGIANLTRLAWVQSNPELVREAMIEHRDFIDRLGRCITVEPDKSISQDDVLAVAKHKAETGHQVIIIDPITLRARSGNAWDADEDLIRGLKAIASQYKTTIICVLHPAKGVVLTPDLSSLSGGAIISRAMDTIVWLDHHGEPKQSSVAIADGFSATEEVTHNRSIIILKSRDGSGTGAKIACDLSSESLLLSEIGLILKKPKKTQE